VGNWGGENQNELFEKMKLLTNQKNETTKTTHTFELAGHRANISVSNWSADEGWVATRVKVAGHEPVHVAAFHVADAETAQMLTQDTVARLQQDGTTRPGVNEGDVFDCGASHNTGQIQELCEALKLNPHDITDYELVDLGVRAAAIELGRKIALQQSRGDGNIPARLSAKRTRRESRTQGARRAR
jgi:hypothetical protein